MTFDVIVVGGGASGLVASIFAASSKAKVCLVEKENKLGKKILQTGNGKCNLANENLASKFFNQPEVEKIFSQFGLDDTKQFFSKLGIEVFSDEEGRIYPLSENARDVSRALELSLQSLNVSTQLDTTVQKIEKVNGNFVVETTNQTLTAKSIIVATGGNTAKNLLSVTGHTFSEERPVLVGYKCSGKFFKPLAGVRVNASLNIKNGDKEFFEKGQIQLRENGISGIVVYNASAFIVSNCTLPVEAKINFLPTENKLYEKLLLRKETCKHLHIEEFLLGLLSKNLALVVLEKSNLTSKLSDTCDKLTTKEIMQISKTISEFSVIIEEPFGEPQVHAGGVKLKELDNMQSKLVSGLFVCGEAVDVFGACGGYNLQWAWSSGAVAGKEATKGKNE